MPCPFCFSTLVLYREGGLLSPDVKVKPHTCYSCQTKFPWKCPRCGKDEAVGRNSAKAVDGHYEYGCWYCGGLWTHKDWMASEMK